MRRPAIHLGLRTLILLSALAMTPTTVFGLADPPAADADLPRYLDGLVDLRTPQVLDHYIQTHPASDDRTRALFALARARMALAVAATDASKPLTSADRLDLVKAALDARRALLDATPADDARRPIILADQASDLLFQLLPLDGGNLTVLFGVPSPDLSRRVREAVSQAADLAAQASSMVDGTIARLEASSGYASNAALQEQRRVLAQSLRERRLPFLRGVALALDAFLDPQAAGGAAAAQANAALETLIDAAAADGLDPAITTQARLHRTLALLLLKKFDDALAQADIVAKDSAASPGDVFFARLASVRIRAARSGLGAGLEALGSIESNYRGKDSLFFRMLIADARFLLLKDQAAASPAETRTAALARSFDAYTSLLDADFGVPKSTLRAIVASRLVEAAALAQEVAPIPDGSLPPLVALARDEALARDPATRQKAIVDLEDRLARPDALSGDDRAAALFALGRALHDFNEPLLAAQRFAQLAEEHPSDPRAETAVELAATLAAKEHERHPDDAQALAALHRALDVLLQRYANLASTDRWRYVAGGLDLAEGKYDAAMEHFTKITPGSEFWIDAHAMQAAVASSRADAAMGGDKAVAASANQEALAVIDRMGPIIQAGVKPDLPEARRAAIQEYLATLKVQRAQILLNLSRAPQALEEIASLDERSDPSPRVRAEALRIRINACQALGRVNEALKDIEAFLSQAPASVPGTLGPLLGSQRQEVQSLVDASRDDDASALAARSLLPIARLVEAWLSSPAASSVSVGDRSMLDRRLADALRLSNQPKDALAYYDRLLKASSDDQDLLLGRAECLFAVGNDQNLADAMGIYKRLAAAAPSGPTWWLAQLRMLQIIDRAGRRVEQILPRIAQLRAQDPQFGGERFRRGFDALRAKHQQ